MDANENEYAELLAKMPERIHLEPWADFYEGSIPEADEYGDYSEGFMEYVRADVYQEASDLLKEHEAAWDELRSRFLDSFGASWRRPDLLKLVDDLRPGAEE